MTHRGTYVNFRALAGMALTLSVFLLTGGVAQAAIQCYQCHGDNVSDIRPIDATYRNITTGGFRGNHQTHMQQPLNVTTGPNACAHCHNNKNYTQTHRTGAIKMSWKLKGYSSTTAGTGRAKYNKAGTWGAGSGAGSIVFFNSTSIPVYQTCSKVSCHFETITPAWGQTTTWASQKAAGNDTNNTCQNCHSNASLSTAHAKHLAAYGGATAVTPCAKCHSDYNALGSTAAFSHATSATRSISISFAAAPNSGTGTISGQRAFPGFLPSINGATTGVTCNTVYCHSVGNLSDATGSGTVVAAGGATYRSPTWSGTLGCDGCHGNQAGKAHPVYATGAAGTTTANTHVAHVETSALSCDYCHNTTTTDTTIPPTTTLAAGAHTDRIETVSFKLFNGLTGTYDATVGTKTCSATACHGSVSPKWGANNDSNATCTKCHGKQTALANYSSATAAQSAPGYGQTGTDLAGQTGTYTNNVSNDPQVGAHDAHMRAVNLYTGLKTLCSDCHAVPATPTSAGHMNGGTAEMTWSNKAKNIGNTGRPGSTGALSPSYAGGGGACTATYCHGTSMAGGVNTSPSWTGTLYLTSYAKNSANCGQCHGAPPTAAPANYTHGGYTIASGCTSCHGHEGNGPTHIDGALQAAGGGCDGCHDYDTVGATLTNGVWSGGTWGKSAQDDGLGQGWGAHAKHVNVIKTRRGILVALNTATSFGTGDAAEVCGTCHTNTLANHNTGGGAGDVRSINFGDSNFKVGTAGTSLLFGPSNTVYNGSTNVSAATAPKTCSNLSCHYFTTPNWSAY